jgi:chromosome segregation ATPase
MTELREHIGHALANLYEVSKHLDEADTAEDRRHALANLCTETEAKLHQAREALGPVKAEYDRVKKDLDAKNRLLEDQKARSLAAINSQVETAQAELWQLEEKIQKARQAIKETDASTESLLKRLRIG